MASKKNEVSSDIKDMAKELAMLEADPTAEVEPVSKAKTAAKKATAAAKSTAKKATAKASETAKKATTAAKSTAKKVAANATAKKDIKKTAIVEYAGNQYEVTDIIARCEASYKSESKKKSYKDIKVYIKPENNAAYYVVDGKSASMINLI